TPKTNPLFQKQIHHHYQEKIPCYECSQSTPKTTEILNINRDPYGQKQQTLDTKRKPRSNSVSSSDKKIQRNIPQIKISTLTSQKNLPQHSKLLPHITTPVHRRAKSWDYPVQKLINNNNNNNNNSSNNLKRTTSKDENSNIEHNMDAESAGLEDQNAS